MVFTVFLLGARHDEGSLGNKPTTLIDIILAKAFNVISDASIFTVADR